jgi:pyruvate formate lyase activating enzyme
MSGSKITTLLIPGENDSEDEVRALSEWVGAKLGPDVPLHFTAVHPDFRMMDKPPTPVTTLLRARETAREVGLKHVYVGNCHHAAAQSSYCSGCGARLIGRNWYELSEWRLTAKGRLHRMRHPFPRPHRGPTGPLGQPPPAGADRLSPGVSPPGTTHRVCAHNSSSRMHWKPSS